ncbi:site-specific integrase [Dyadobacter sandarakinus]|uniref:Site-specific integrase n=1 Tax=Dyadobacter sandarakinus TaxID=2747268 RepID=A0ABX7IAR7_9BACT|nr:site-specific integrase [Dyadobacter sandarakinus]QRR02617.1 site-specific integrase [Dyadobacter sandarakinus]
MATTKYYLKKPKPNGNCLISLYFRYGTEQVVVSTNQFIKPKSWDAKNQKAKASHEAYLELNANLDRWRNEVQKIYQQRLYQKLSITPADLKPLFEREIRTDKYEAAPEKGKPGLIEFVTKYIKSVEGFKNANTIKTYRSHLKMLTAYQTDAKKKTIAFNDITLDFYHDFKRFMVEVKKYNENTQNKHTGFLKFFLNEATERKENDNIEFKSRRFSTPRKEVDSIYLNEDEIKLLMKLDLSAESRLEKVRDLFIVGCFTGLRFSDLTAIQAENISPDFKYLKTKTIKTDEYLEIPIHPIVRKVMEKYKGKTPNNLPPVISNQKMNEYLKEIGEKANLSDDVALFEKKGKVRTQKKVSKFSLITSHTARRSFATNEYLAGTPSYAIMAITGHRTEKAFLTYIKVTKKQYARQLSEIWKERFKDE